MVRIHSASRLVVGSVLVAVSVLPSLLEAATWSAGLEAGALVPLSKLHDQEVGGTSVSFAQRAAPVFGGRVGMALGQRLVLELRGFYAASDVDYDVAVAGGASESVVRPAHVTGGVLRVAYVVHAPPLRPWKILAAAGLGYVDRGGDFFDDASLTGDTSGLAAEVGASLQYGLRPRTYLRIDLVDTMSSYAAADRFETTLQHDLSLRAGLEMWFGH